MRHSFETENCFLSSQRETSILDPANEVFCYSTYFSLDSVWFVCSLCPALAFKERRALGVAWREFSKSCPGGKCCFSPGWFLTPWSEVLPSRPSLFTFWTLLQKLDSWCVVLECNEREKEQYLGFLSMLSTLSWCVLQTIRFERLGKGGDQCACVLNRVLSSFCFVLFFKDISCSVIYTEVPLDQLLHTVLNK